MSGPGTIETRTRRVAFQGELGAFSEEAVRRFFGDTGDPVPCRRFREVGAAVLDGAVEYGLLPIENTLAGSVSVNYDVLASEGIGVVGEIVAPIHHCVLGVPGSTIEDAERALSHPVALAQCTRFLTEHEGIDAVAVYDTAGAARQVADDADPAVLAIAGRPAADRYDLEILAADIEDRADNQTRFLVIARRDRGADPLLASDPDASFKTSLLVETENVPGALMRVLLPFSRRSVNLSKLESRPGDAPWCYRFFMELEANADDAAARQALEEVRRCSSVLRVLGSYPRWPTR